MLNDWTGMRRRRRRLSRNEEEEKKKEEARGRGRREKKGQMKLENMYTYRKETREILNG